MEAQLVILFLALVLDWYVGDPDWLWGRIPHPVALFGRLISLGEEGLYHADASASRQYKSGAILISGLVIASLILGWLLAELLDGFGIIGMVIELLLVAVMIAQKSLVDHVGAVATGIRERGIEGGREAVGRIVGRDPETLDGSSGTRAAIESLAENFSDGVVAPAFWYAVFGLPGLFAYKMINTADSMIAYRNEKYLHFGRVTAQIDDLANWLPARISAFILAIGALFAEGRQACVRAVRAALDNARLHRSPNAGWPEAAMAGAIDVALGGPRIYADTEVSQSHINASGRHELGPADIECAMKVFTRACQSLWVAVLVLAILL